MNEHSSFLTSWYGILLFLAVLVFIFWRIWKIGNRNALKVAYEKLCLEIEKDLKKKPTPEMYAILSEKLDELDGMKYKDNIKRNDLYKRFWSKFEKEASKVIKEFEKKQLKMKV